jgi:hypothetical protein
VGANAYRLVVSRNPTSSQMRSSLDRCRKSACKISADLTPRLTLIQAESLINSEGGNYVPTKCMMTSKSDYGSGRGGKEWSFIGPMVSPVLIVPTIFVAIVPTIFVALQQKCRSSSPKNLLIFLSLFAMQSRKCMKENALGRGR